MPNQSLRHASRGVRQSCAKTDELGDEDEDAADEEDDADGESDGLAVMSTWVAFLVLGYRGKGAQRVAS